MKIIHYLAIFSFICLLNLLKDYNNYPTVGNWMALLVLELILQTVYNKYKNKI